MKRLPRNRTIEEYLARERRKERIVEVGLIWLFGLLFAGLVAVAIFGGGK